MSETFRVHKRRRLLLTVALISTFVICVLGFGLLKLSREMGRSPREAALSAYDAGDWAGALSYAEAQLSKSPDDPISLQTKSRALAQLGKFRDAFTILQALNSDRIEAEDLLWMSRFFAKEGNLAFAIAALEVAQKLDKNKPNIRSALADLQTKLKTDARATAQLDRLSAIPNTSAKIASLVTLGMIDDLVGESTHLQLTEKAFRSTRATFAKFDTQASVYKFTARLLLESGRSREARDLLLHLDSSVVDAERDWLLSRTYLTEGSIDEATKYVEKSGRFADEHPTLTEPGRYAGAKSCGECHGTTYKTQQSSNHAATITRGADLKNLRIPSGPVADSEDPDVIHEWVRKNDDIEASVRVNGKHYQGLVDYVLGSGHHGKSMLAKEADGSRTALRLSHYTPVDQWQMTGGFNPHPTDPHTFLGERLGDDAFRACIDCHSTTFATEAEHKGPVVTDKGIGCERCHGPGENHLRSIEAGFAQLAIARPKIAKPTERMAICAQCHQANGTIPPSDPRFIRFQSTTLTYSKCYTESKGKFDCIACHDPHRNAETRADYYEKRCVSCHTENLTNQDIESTKTQLRFEPVMAKLCPTNPKTDCLNCHMPKLDNVMPFSKFTDHHIRVFPK